MVLAMVAGCGHGMGREACGMVVFSEDWMKYSNIMYCE